MQFDYSTKKPILVGLFFLLSLAAGYHDYGIHDMTDILQYALTNTAIVSEIVREDSDQADDQ